VRSVGHGPPAARKLYADASLLPATACVIGVVVLRQVPSVAETCGIALVILGIALHRPNA
jgi:threonine/homoserine efflux transporter RhtA